jgi:hypothetical protein
MFADCFGPAGWKQLQKYWDDHRPTSGSTLSGELFASQTFLPPTKPLILEPQVHVATRAEAVRIRSEYEWRIAREFGVADPELARQCLDQAGRRLHKAYNEGERDPRFLAVLALYECDAGAPTAARQYVDEAAATRVVRPSLYYEQARFRYAEERAKLAAPDGKLDAEQTRRVLEPLETARAQKPALDEVYQLTTEIWARSAVPPTPEALAVLAEGVKLFPRDPVLAYKAGLVHVRAGASREAAAIAAQGLRFAPVGSDLQSRLQKLQDAARVAPAAPAPVR